MRVEQGVSEFKPVTIILESAEEVQLLFNIMESNCENCDYDSAERYFLTALINELSEKHF